MRRMFIVNPASGGGRTARAWESFCRREAFDAGDITYTEAPGHGEELAERAADDGYDAVIAVGGDGTLNEIVNGCMRHAGTDKQLPAVGLIPSGTGNDFARGMGIARTMTRALDGCLTHSAVPIDLGKIGERYFVNVAGFGFDAEVAVDVSRRTGSKPAGTLPYVISVMRQLRTYRAKKIRLTADGEAFQSTVLFGAVGNASTYGGGMRVCPLAIADDGLFDLCLAGDLTRIETLVNLIRVFKGTHVTQPKFTYRRFRHLRVDGDPSVRVHADGQIAGTLPLEIRVVPHAISMLLPTKG